MVGRYRTFFVARLSILCALGSLVFLTPWPLNAEPEKGDKKEPELRERLVHTDHSVTIGDKKVDYTATAGTIMLKTEEGKARAGIFFVAYTLKTENRKRRPITFTFNGGPGSSAVWLHMGAFGPRRVDLSETGEAPPPPYKLVNNDCSILDVTDLVFIDPVMTGYSRPAPGEDAKHFLGVQQDVESIGDFIRQYISRFDRWDSPRFLAGESYGTTRAAGLSGYLQDHHGINLNGVILISSVLNFGTIRFDEGNDLPYGLFLPTFTAVAWYHKKLTADFKDLKSALTESEKFAQGEYAQFLMKGSRATDEEVASVRRNLARLTGLSEEICRPRQSAHRSFPIRKELLRDRRRMVGRYDGRYQGIDLDAAGEHPEYDPSYAAVQGIFTSTLNEYLRTSLKYETELTYEILSDRVQPWDFGNARNRYLNVAPTLRSSMTKNRDLRLFVASGFYDLATPYFATDYTLNHLGLDGVLADHVTVAYYEAGHMMYVHRPSHEKLRRDLLRFYRAATPE